MSETWVINQYLRQFYFSLNINLCIAISLPYWHNIWYFDYQISNRFWIWRRYC